LGARIVRSLSTYFGITAVTESGLARSAPEPVVPLTPTKRPRSVRRGRVAELPRFGGQCAAGVLHQVTLVPKRDNS
jgi:hypothetical protein